MSFLNFSFAIFIIAAAGFIFYIVAKKIRHKYFLDALKLKLLSVKLARKYEKSEKDDWAKEINLTGQLASILVNLKVPFSFESAVNYIGEEIFFYVAIPGDSMQFVTRQIHGLWPDAQVEEVDDYNIFNNTGFSTTLMAFFLNKLDPGFIRTCKDTPSPKDSIFDRSLKIGKKVSV